IAGKLTIKNKSDGTEHLFNLRGVGGSPLALEHIKLNCKCREDFKYTVTVPNFAPHKLTYKVVTDIPYLDGVTAVTVLKGHHTDYNFTLSPWQQGVTKGVLAFVVEDAEKSRILSRDDSDSDKEDGSVESTTPAYLKPQKSLDNMQSYRVWYSLEIEAEPSDPMSIIEIECPVQQSAYHEIPVCNPSGEIINFDIKVKGNALEGDSQLLLHPNIPATYRLQYSPCVVGNSTGSVFFYSQQTGEFWYKLVLICTPPPPTHMPIMDCQIGRWCRQLIPMINPTDDPM
uniref:Uncharacterized protein n=1 Tax=Ciona savignyi TaxID=51511 RepID=H2YRV7_CIOSA